MKRETNGLHIQYKDRGGAQSHPLLPELELAAVSLLRSTTTGRRVSLPLRRLRLRSRRLLRSIFSLLSLPTRSWHRLVGTRKRLLAV